MKKLLIAAVFAGFIFAVSCQAPQEIKTNLDKQTEQIKALETKLADQGAKLEQLRMDFEKHMVDLHKKPVAGKPTPPPAAPPTRVGR